LSPIVTAGLPAPGLLSDEDAELDELVDELLPHAAKPMLSAVTANSAVALPPAVLNLLLRVPGMYAASFVDLLDRIKIINNY
jgi:hypothetical protein